MILDTSAVIAIFFDEPERNDFLQSIYTDSRRLISAATFVEVQLVLTSTSGAEGVKRLQAFLDRLEVQVVAFDLAQSRLAGEAFRTFGKGRHPARLNFGDCFSYALAKQTGEPLLYKGDDFAQTDIPSAISGAAPPSPQL